MSAAGAERCGSGCLVLAVGPSGAGKDTLISIAATRLCACAHCVRAPDRDARGRQLRGSRQSDAGGLRRCAGGGEFALAWRAHGHCYGVPQAAARRLEAGDTLAFNVSRAVIAAARAQFAKVLVVHVTAPPNVLESRLKARGRDGDIAARPARSVDMTRHDAADLLIENIGERHANAEVLAEFRMRTLI